MEDVTQLVSRILFHGLGIEESMIDAQFLSGGCINMSVKVETKTDVFFIKWNELEQRDLFKKEIDGLEHLRFKSSLRIPEVLASGEIEEKVFVILEYLEEDRLQGDMKQGQLGEGLAELHAHTADGFGYHISNYIGRLPQNNERENSWIDFFANRRLRVQLGLAIYEERVDASFVSKFEKFLTKLSSFMPESKPSLLHGDLWSGNVLMTTKGSAIFDPAVYYGAPEMDIAMTRLFGGFSKAFYEAYEANGTLNENFEELVDLYNLYPLMVHVNLFGQDAGYLGTVKKIIERYL